MELKTFEKPDRTFYAIKEDDGQFFIESEGGFTRESDNMDNNDLLSWADIVDLDDEYYLENGEPYFDAIRRKKESEENLDYDSYPGGRAYFYFNNFQIPEEIDVYFDEGLYPGDNAVYYIANNFRDLVNLQSYMEEKGKKINFNLQGR